ncbi:hypothetical protein F5884DRAFT_880589 [Xylogone sp. PMI_703]|nr:hypothetical protein F5884DRAFT_880589 [Xylogone sp. PMI_703]
MASKRERAIRIAGASGSSSDRRSALADLAANCDHDPVDVIVGDWLSEANMTKSAGRLKTGSGLAYELSFIEALSPALRDLAKYGIKVVVNAGASDTLGLYNIVLKLVERFKLPLKVAWIEGDSVLDVIQKEQRNGVTFQSICTGEKLVDWKFDPIYAHAYLGGLGIAKALDFGADIVVCGRVSDASMVIGSAVWWHKWRHDQLEELANALIAGHLIECSTYVCGGNFTGFKSLQPKSWQNIGYPIAEISKGGEVIITKQKNTGGLVSPQTCTSQLLYEIQGPWYFNSDVTAVINNISFENLSMDRVAVRGVQALPPPRTTKVGITASGGFQAEVHYFIVGLDAKEKAKMLEEQIRYILQPYLKKFTLLDFSIIGSVGEDADSQNAATVDFRILAQTASKEDLKPRFFVRPITDCIMQAYPGATFHLDLRTAFPKPIYEYFVTLLPQSLILHKVHIQDGRSFKIDSPKDDDEQSVVYPQRQPSEDEAVLSTAMDPDIFSNTVRGPLGWLVHARSGDKGSNANVGFWVRHEDEYDWLRSLLSVNRMKQLLGKEYSGNKIDRVEFPNLFAVHFLLHDHLDRGVSCTKTYDVLGKNLAEYLRGRHVDLPARFLNRGKL